MTAFLWGLCGGIAAGQAIVSRLEGKGWNTTLQWIALAGILTYVGVGLL